ncbi:hypothetical protein INR49_003753, partial [Caranx melampygus]
MQRLLFIPRGCDLLCKMTGTLVSPKKGLLWILCVLWISAAGEDTACPKGAQVHLSSMRCYWMSETTSSWYEARDSCRQTPGGDVASADSLELLSFIHSSFP